MGFYDVFISKKHPAFVQKLLVKFNANILRHCRIQLKLDTEKLRVLEIGPGLGYFYRACIMDSAIDYFAMDRNTAILETLQALPPEKRILGEAPKLPNFSRKFDIIYAGFVIEHFAEGGLSVFNFIQNCKKNLRDGGLLVLAAPDCERLGMEFWNIDYTHTFPVTKRSLAMAFNDCGICDFSIYEIPGLMTHRYFHVPQMTFLINLALLPYQYKLFNWFAGSILGRKPYLSSNLFYKAYAFCKEPNLLIVAKIG